MSCFEGFLANTRIKTPNMKGFCGSDFKPRLNWEINCYNGCVWNTIQINFKLEEKLKKTRPTWINIPFDRRYPCQYALKAPEMQEMKLEPNGHSDISSDSSRGRNSNAQLNIDWSERKTQIFGTGIKTAETARFKSFGVCRTSRRDWYYGWYVQSDGIFVCHIRWLREAETSQKSH